MTTYRDCNTTLCDHSPISTTMSEHPSAARDLQKLRQNIVALKDDRSTYIKTTDVLRYYGELTELLRAHEEYFGDAAVALETGSGSTKSLIQLECRCFQTPLSIALLY